MIHRLLPLLALLGSGPAWAATTLVDSDRGADYSGSLLSSVATPSMTGAANDSFVCSVKWEGATGSTVTITSSGFTLASQGGTAATLHPTSTDHSGQMFYGKISAGTAGTLVANFSPTRPYAGIHCYIFRPTAGQELVFDTSATPTTGDSNVNNPATGSTANAGAGAAVVGFAYYDSIDPTATTPGTGWAAYTLTTTESTASLYRILSGAGSIVGDVNHNGQDTLWVANMVILKEQAAAASSPMLKIMQQQTAANDGAFESTEPLVANSR